MAQRWQDFSEEKLLDCRLCDLKLKLSHSPFLPLLEQLKAELASKELPLELSFYLGDEWFSPEGQTAIAIPFFLADSRLVELERKFMLEVEGEKPLHFMKLLRHEAGHCFDHAYAFSRSAKWRKVFGSPKQEYDPDSYRPRPYSRSYVRHLENWYAQSHPDEDFAESFAVWLNPASNWEVIYRNWPVVLAKLNYIEELAGKARKKGALVRSGYHISDATKSKKTLRRYYELKRKEREHDLPYFFDRDLYRIFSGNPSLSAREFGAERFLRKHRKDLLRSVSNWTGERKFNVERLLIRLMKRCQENSLRLGASEEKTLVELVAYVSSLVTNYLFTGKFKRNV